MYNIIQHSHSGIMWLAVIMLILSVLFSFIKIIKKDDIISSGLLKLYYLTKWILYLQTILGIVLLFISPKVIYDKGYLKFGEWAESGGTGLCPIGIKIYTDIEITPIWIINNPTEY